MKIILWAAAAIGLSLPVAAIAQPNSQRVVWNRPIAPFRVVGNVYYVGTRGLSAFLVTGRAGHVLIDGALPESAPLIAANIEKLGFRLKDIKYLLINHAHYDHSGGLAELKKRTGARLLASAGDRADLESGKVAGRPKLSEAPPVTVDRVIVDGEVLKVGTTTLTANLTPGHTRGCTSWSIRAAGKTVLFACSLTVAGQNLIDDPTYPDAAKDFRATLAKLRTMKADVFLTFHPEFFHMEAKRAKLAPGKPNPFVDPTELARVVAQSERAFDKELAEQREGH